MTGLTNTSTYMQGLFLQYLHKTVITILCLGYLYTGISMVVYLMWSLQLSLRMSLQGSILRSIHEIISTTVHLLLFLIASLRSKILQSSLLTSLRSKFLRSFLPFVSKE